MSSQAELTEGLSLVAHQNRPKRSQREKKAEQPLGVQEETSEGQGRHTRTRRSAPEVKEATKGS